MARFGQSFAAVMPNVLEVIERFPLAALISLLLTGYLLQGAAQNEDVILWSFGLISMFFGTVGARLYAERREWGALPGLLLGLIVTALIALLFFFGQPLHVTPPMMPVAFVLAASTVAYLNLPPDNRSYWMFNHTYWFSLAIAFMGGLLIAALVALLIAAYAMLFDVAIGKAYQYSFIVSMFLVAPMFWLSILPRSLTVPVEEGEPVEFTSRVTALFVKYVFVPFFFLFAALLHGLAIKVLLEGELPSGQIGWYGLSLMIGGVGTYLMAYPTRQVSGPLVRFFVSTWMWFLVVPLVMVGAAHYLRVAHYGMTPMRFYLAGLFIWALVLIVYGFYVKYFARRGDEALSIRGDFDLRLIAILAAFILFISSFGPWGAEAVSTSWQTERLVAQLKALDVLEDGVIAKQLPSGKDAARGTLARDARDTLNYFRDRERAEGLITLLPEARRVALEKEISEEGAFNGRRSRVYLALNDVLTGTKSGEKEAPRAKNYTVRVQEPLNFALPGRGQLIGPVFHSLDRQLVQQTAEQNSDSHVPQGLEAVEAAAREAELATGALSYEVEDGYFIARRGADILGQFPLETLSGFARQHDKAAQASKQVADVMMVAAREGAARLYVSSLSYKLAKAGEPEIIGIRFWLYLPE